MTHRIAWDELITDLHRARLRATEIADKVGVGRTTIVAYREDGHTPLHPTGERLIELWITVTHKSRAELPRVGELQPSERTSMF
jgi:hypothetical protein